MRVRAVGEQKTLSLAISSAIFPRRFSSLRPNMVRDSMSKYLFSDLHRRDDSLRTVSLSIEPKRPGETITYTAHKPPPTLSTGTVLIAISMLSISAILT